MTYIKTFIQKKIATALFMGKRFQIVCCRYKGFTKFIGGSCLVLLVVFPGICEEIDQPKTLCNKPKSTKPTGTTQQFMSTSLLLTNINLECEEVTKAAKVDFPDFLKAAWAQKTDFGFHKNDTITSVVLDTPICVYGIDEEVSKLVRDGKPLASVIKPVGEWIFPVMVGTTYRTIFGMRIVADKWKGVYLGNPYLAKSFEGLRKAWGGKQGDKFKLLSSTDPRGFFFVVTGNKNPNLTPVTRVVLNDGKLLVPELDWRSLQKTHDVLEALDSHWASKAAILMDVETDLGFSMEVEDKPTSNELEKNCNRVENNNIITNHPIRK